jgi:hypothetical protein
MRFKAVLYITCLRCLTRDNTNMGKKSNTHKDAQKDEAVTKASLLLVGTIQASS